MAGDARAMGMRMGDTDAGEAEIMSLRERVYHFSDSDQ